MIEGLDRFKSHFADFTDQYVLIGGAACTVVMEDVGQFFRATKDLDIVLCVEVLDVKFVAAFWRFIRDGEYQTQERATGEKQFYRFLEPKKNGYPFMLELFSREPDALTPAPGSHLSPIPMDEEISSLSAILMDDDYYTFLQSGKKTVDGVQVAGPEHLIPLKAKAWLDLSKRKADGANIDSKDIRKHKNDVFRLFAIVDPEFDGHIPSQVKTDLAMFVARMPDEGVDLKAMGLGSETLDNVSSQLRRIYGLD